MKINKFDNYSIIYNKLIYLAVPYTAHDIAVQVSRYTAVTTLSARLVERGIDNISPITTSHNQQEMVRLPHTWDFWERHDLNILRRCDEIWVYTLPGWKESVGVQGEIEDAKELGIPVRYLTICPGRLGQMGDIEINEKPTETPSCHI